MGGKTDTTLSGLGLGKDLLIPTFWSRDGRWLTSYVQDPVGTARGFALFDVATSRVRRLNDDSEGFELPWLPDFRHVVYFGPGGTLVMQDIESLARRKVTGTLPYPPEETRSIVAAPDGRTLYYGAKQVEANIWMVKRPPRETAPR